MQALSYKGLCKLHEFNTLMARFADIEKNMLRNYILIDYYEFSGLTMHAVVFLRSKISISEHKTIYKSNSIILRLSI